MSGRRPDPKYNTASDVQDVAGTARAILSQAVEYCAAKMGLPGGQAAIDLLRADDGPACDYCHYSIARQVAELLGRLDGNIEAAYILECDAVPGERCNGEGGGVLPIHLLVRVGRKTAALKVLVETWDRNLAQSYGEIVGRHQPGHVLDVQVVDGADVEKRIGYGALLSALHHRPIQIWRRGEPDRE